jgi:hypothetical protein
MRRWVVVAALIVSATAAFAKDGYLTIGGSVGAFRTDARIFNPSTTKDITIHAYYLPVGNADNSAVQAVDISVPKRQMVLYDDVVASLFHAGGLGAIRLLSDDDFIATSRIYAQTSATSCQAAGTLGQFLEGDDVSSASTGGVLIQLKASGAFRTNIGAVNPNNAAAHVTWRLYDKNNALVATGSPITMPPYAVIGPTNVTSGFFFNAAGFDLSDSWVSFASDQPVFAYASVVDNTTTDPTYIAMSKDSGSSAITTPTAKTFDVTLRSFEIVISPAITASTFKQNDQVTFRITNVQTDTTHGFTLVSPTGVILVPDRFYPPGSGTVTQNFTLTREGTYSYYCTNSTCGTGHTSMIGSFDVGQPSVTDPGSKY